MFPSPAILKRGPILNGPTALPATTEMLVLDSSGNITTQSIPVASFDALTGSPSDNAALSSALNAKLNLTGGTLTGGLSGTTGTFSGTITSLSDANNYWQVGGASLIGRDNGVDKIRIDKWGPIYVPSAARIHWTDGGNLGNSIDATFGRNGAGQLGAYGNNGFASRNYANSADAPITASTGTFSGLVTGAKIVASDGYVYGAPQFYSSAYGAGASGLQIVSPAATALYGNGRALFAAGNDTNGVKIAGELPLGWVNGHALAAVVDVTLRRNATGPSIETRSAGGMVVNDATGSSRAALACGAILASGLVTGTKIVASDGYVYGAPQFYSSAFGSNTGMQIVNGSTTALYGNGIALFAAGNDANGIRFDGSRPIGFVNGHALATAPDVTIRRNATGPAIETRSAGGLIVNNADGSAFAPIQVGNITQNSGALSTDGIRFNNTASGTQGNIQAGYSGNYIGSLVISSGSPLTPALAIGTNNVFVKPISMAGASQSISHSSNTQNRIDFSVPGTPGVNIGALDELRLSINSNQRLSLNATTAAFSTAITASGNVSGNRADFSGFYTTANFNGGGYLISSNGILGLYSPDTAVGLTRLQFGSGSSNPALKRNGVSIQFRLADDSADAPITASNGTFSGTITHGFQTLVANPSTVDITTGLSRMVKNSTLGELRLWANDGGTMKSTLLS